MKKLILSMALAGAYVTALAQGTIFFGNASTIGGPVNAPVYHADQITPLDGPQFMAELLAGAAEDSLTTIATAPFLTGASAGYFFGGFQTINGVAPGNPAWFRVDVWNTASGASYVQAVNSGLPDSWWSSGDFLAQTGGDPTVDERFLTGLGRSRVFLNSVPEPSPLALACFGLAGMLILRRRTRP
jgi:hypothetical protein